MGVNTTDTQLIKRVQQGDKKAFDLLVRKYQQRIINLVNRFTHNVNDAQDIAQEVFLKSYRALPNFRGDSAFYTWLYRIAVNTTKNHLSERARKPLYFGVNTNDEEQTNEELTLNNEDTPEQLLLRDEVQDTVVKTIAVLPENLRVAIMLREIEGLSYEDIAKVMDCPIGTVRSRIFRARDEINKALNTL